MFIVAREETRVGVRPRYVNPGYNGTVQTVTMGQSTHIDCQVADLLNHQV